MNQSSATINGSYSDNMTALLGYELHLFMTVTCSHFWTLETQQEYEACKCGEVCHQYGTIYVTPSQAQGSYYATLKCHMFII